jgi:hypothetical protein
MSTYAALIWCGVWTGLALGLLAILFLIYDGISLRCGRRKRFWQSRRVWVQNR